MEKPKKNTEGIELLLRKPVMYERFPVLEAILGRSALLFMGRLYSLLMVPLEVRLESTQTIRYGEYLSSLENGALMGVFHTEEWDNDGYLMMMPELTLYLIELMLGGQPDDKSAGKQPDVSRLSYTSLEQHLIKQLAGYLLGALQESFSAITSVSFQLDRLENHTHATSFMREDSPCVVAHFSVSIGQSNSVFQVVLPHTLIQPIRHLLSDGFVGEKLGRDSLWLAHMERELPNAPVTLHAVLDEMTVSLREVMAWEKGTSFYLTVHPDSSVTLKCGGRSVFAVKMGQKQGDLAFVIEDTLL